MIIKKCKVCGKEFYKTSGYGKKGWAKRKYCSRACNLRINSKPAPKTGKIIICKICGKPFYARNWELTRSKFKRQCCSWNCYNLSRKKTKLLIKCKQCGKEFWTRQDKLKKGIGIFCSKKCMQFKDVVKYSGLHYRVKMKLGRPNNCEHCGKAGGYIFLKRLNKPIKRWNIQLANKSGLYLYDLSDWLHLCISCHRKYDLRSNQLLTINK